jgi:predicted SprT family Zn-dependent metalloprotease
LGLSNSWKALWRTLNAGGSMELSEAHEIAVGLMQKHNLRGWTFQFNRNKRRLGVCKQDDKRIELSEHYVLRNDRQHVLDTILHEIAHAIVGTEHGHDDIWKDMCARIGSTPSSCSSTANMPDGYWQARCPGCYTVFTRHRKPRRLRGRYCVACGPDRGQLVFRDMRIVKPTRPKPAVAAALPPKQEETFAPKQLLLKLFFG